MSCLYKTNYIIINSKIPIRFDWHFTNINISKITLARELWDIIPADKLKTFASTIIHHCSEHCNPLLPNGSLTILLIDDNGNIFSE